MANFARRVISQSPQGLSKRTLRTMISDDTWFITFTCHDWLPLFGIAQAYDLVYNWFKLIDDKYGIKIAGFVIMPNHVHLLARLTERAVDLNKIMSNAKRFMAYALIQRLTSQQNHDLLARLSSACSGKERAKGQKHKIFETSFDAKSVFTIDFLHQKLDYIHHNPVKGKWNLCDEFTDYVHSSAAFYELEKPHPFVDITDYRSYWY